MNYDHLNDIYSDYLEHYGVKGIKWGKKKYVIGKNNKNTVAARNANSGTFAKPAIYINDPGAKVPDWIKVWQKESEEKSRREGVKTIPHKAVEDRASETSTTVSNVGKSKLSSMRSKTINRGDKVISSMMKRAVSKKKK